MKWLRMFAVIALVAALIVYSASEVLEQTQQDDTLPNITCEGPVLEISCDYTIEELLQGMQAYDEKDGDLTAEILVGNFTRFIQPGYCQLSYTVFDSDEHMATLTRDVYFTDYRSPQFSLSTPLCFPVSSTTVSQIRDMFSAYDQLDGNLTPWISYVESNVVTTVPGDYSITMEVANSFGDSVRYEFPVHIYSDEIQDYVITLKRALVTLTVGDTFTPLDYVESVEDLQGDEVDVEQLDVTSSVDTETAGIYQVHYEIEADPEEDTEEADESSYGQTWLTVIVQEDHRR